MFIVIGKRVGWGDDWRKVGLARNKLRFNLFFTVIILFLIQFKYLLDSIIIFLYYNSIADVYCNKKAM